MDAYEAKEYFVYILANKKNGTLYTGITSDLHRRVWEHKSGEYRGFTKKYAVTNLVYFETYDDVFEAIGREKNIKKWKRLWKIQIIEKNNPGWNDLYLDL